MLDLDLAKGSQSLDKKKNADWQNITMQNTVLSY